MLIRAPQLSRTIIIKGHSNSTIRIIDRTIIAVVTVMEYSMVLKVVSVVIIQAQIVDSPLDLQSQMLTSLLPT